MKKKRILIENDLINGGGVEVVMHCLAKFLCENGYNVNITTLKGTAKEFYEKYPKNIKYIEKNFVWKEYSRLSPMRVIQKILYNIFRIKRHYYLYRNYDVALAIKEGECMKNTLYYNSREKYAWVHVDYCALHWTKYLFDSNSDEVDCMRKYDKIVCVSKSAANSVRKTIGDPGNLCVKYNPIDYRRILKLAEEKCPIYKNEEKPLFVSVGRLDEQKNYSMLLDVCGELNKKYDFELWIVGEGKEREKLENKIESLNLNNVKLCGNMNNPYPVICKADYFVSSSLCESYGIAIQEALILNIPVIATHCPAVEEVFDKSFGILCENSYEGLKNSLETVLENKSLRDEYVNNIVQKYKTDDLYENRLKRICDLWE